MPSVDHYRSAGRDIDALPGVVGMVRLGVVGAMIRMSDRAELNINTNSGNVQTHLFGFFQEPCLKLHYAENFFGLSVIGGTL
jgi:hypothetical protein